MEYGMYHTEDSLFIRGYEPNHSGVYVVEAAGILTTDWHHLGFVLDYGADGTGSLALYIDGDLIGRDETRDNPLMVDGRGPLWVGRAIPIDGNYFNGMIDELKIWDAVLTDDEIQEEYNRRAGAGCKFTYADAPTCNANPACKWNPFLAMCEPIDGRPDPLFVDAERRDLHLRPGSPAIDSGVALPEVTTDLDGNPRPLGLGYDIGAYEFVEEEGSAANTFYRNTRSGVRRLTTGCPHTQSNFSSLSDGDSSYKALERFGPLTFLAQPRVFCYRSGSSGTTRQILNWASS